MILGQQMSELSHRFGNDLGPRRTEREGCFAGDSRNYLPEGHFKRDEMTEVPPKSHGPLFGLEKSSGRNRPGFPAMASRVHREAEVSSV